MSANMLNLIIVLFLLLGTQIIALFVQNRVNKAYPGIKCWLIGSSLIALGFILLPAVSIESIKSVEKIASPLIVAGHLSLYVGVRRFFKRGTSLRIPSIVFLVFLSMYVYFWLIDNNDVTRAYILNAALLVISLFIVYELFFKKDKFLAGTANFTAAIFGIYAILNALRIAQVHQLGHVDTYSEQNFTMVTALFISVIVISNLWTFGLIIMVNQRLNHDNQLEKEISQFIFNTNIDAQTITRLDNGLVVDINEEFTVLTGYSKDEVLGESMRDSDFWVKPEDRRTFAKELNEKDIRKNRDFLFRRKDGSQFIGMISSKVIELESVPHIVSVIRDITKRKESENALIESEAKYRSVLNASPDDIKITDLEGYILMNSPAAKEMFGYDQEEDFTGIQILDFLKPEEIERAQLNILAMHEGSTQNTGEYQGVRKDGSIIDIEVNSGIIYNAHGQADNMIFVIRDITERKLIEQQMEELIEQLEVERNTAQLNSITDSLTGLYNRGYFDKTLWTEFSKAQQSASPLSLIMLDIDNFKKYNDHYGHPAGDRCIQMIATTLMGIVDGTSDTVARYGGEEFIVVLPSTEKEHAVMMGERIRKEIEALAIPHISSTVSDHVTVSVGISTVYPAELASPNEALKIVDDSLYAAKNSGRNCCVFSDRADESK